LCIEIIWAIIVEVLIPVFVLDKRLWALRYKTFSLETFNAAGLAKFGLLCLCLLDGLAWPVAGEGRGKKA
jgi:hypothetical protein